MSALHQAMDRTSTRRREIWRHAFPVAGTGADTGREVEAQGFDGLAMADSQNLVGDPYVALALAAKVTERIHLATASAPGAGRCRPRSCRHLPRCLRQRRDAP